MAGCLAVGADVHFWVVEHLGDLLVDFWGVLGCFLEQESE